MRAKIPVKDGSSTARRENVEHYIHTLDGRDFAKPLTLLRFGDADELEETLMVLQRAKNSKGKRRWKPTNIDKELLHQMHLWHSDLLLL